MPISGYTEDSLVQQTTAEYLEQELGWESVYAYNNEDFGPDSLLGRDSDREVVLTRSLRAKLEELNPGLPAEAYDQAVRELTAAPAAQSLMATNREKHDLIRDGARVTFINAKGARERPLLRVIDFDNPERNEFLCVRELWVKGDLYRRRVDIVGFVNGLPLLFMELKNVHKNLRVAYENNYKDNLDTIPALFHHNAMVVFGNGIEAKVGALGSPYKFFNDWKRLDEDEPGAVNMETLLKGVCAKGNFLDLVENFILFDDSGGSVKKILARNHQYLGVNRAVESARRGRTRRDGKLGVFWHTQGAGKSYSMVLFTRKVHRKLGGNFTFVILTDREDLDSQLYKTFAGCGAVNHDKDPCRAASGRDLKRLLGLQKTHIFSLIQKFNQDVDPKEPYTDRDDVIVITDEAHRTQYGTLALNMRNGLPNASYIGFTGTPLMKDDAITVKVFGDYISTYDFQRAVEDQATVPLYYDARGERLGVAKSDLNERIAEKLEELEEEIRQKGIDAEQRLERELKRDYHILTAKKRLEQVARDFVDHYSTAWQTGKAMLVCLDKVTCVRMHNLIRAGWDKKIAELKREAEGQYGSELRDRIEWMRQTRMAVVVSEEQGEVEKFKRWDLDIRPHRKLMKDGMDLPPELREEARFQNLQRLAVDDAFKEERHPFRVAIVCAMWLTGFDVPCLSTLYLDKPLKAHTLMQAIARANRVNEGKNNGLIVDYCGILSNLRQALRTFAGTGDTEEVGATDGMDPTRPQEELLAELAEAIALVRAFLEEREAPLAAIVGGAGFERNAAIVAAKEAANENDESRKRFEVMCRAVFQKFKACLTIDGVNAHRAERDAINVVYRSLQEDRERADISDVLRELHGVVDAAIETQSAGGAQSALEAKPYDISRIDFDVLKREFSRSPARRTTVQNLRQAIERRVRRLVERNPLRADFQAHYEEIVARYNREKDQATIERTFEALLKFVEELTGEERRAAREGLDEESLAVFDLLAEGKREEMSAAESQRVKGIAIELLSRLKAEKLRVEQWTAKEATRDAVRLEIFNFLYGDGTGLPIDHYTDPEVEARSEGVYGHVLLVYPTLPSPYFRDYGSV